MSIKEIQERHDDDNSNRYQYYLDCGELLDVLKRANEMINNSYQCECGNPKTPCPCLEGFLDNIQAILAEV